MKPINGIMMQYFEWYLECNHNLWNIVRLKGEELAKNGVTSIWLPPACKCMDGANGVGYAIYDLYDLGEFDQKGTIPTKYGTKDEYIEAVRALKQSGVEVYADIVLNHKMGADKAQLIPASKCDWGNHNVEIAKDEMVKVATKFTFPGRKHKYSDFEWNWTHFDAIDYNEKTGEKAIFKFKDKEWGQDVDEEFGNFDYLMGADLDFDNQEVIKECKRWGEWFLEETGVTGFRLDAVKHIKADFYKEWIEHLNTFKEKNIFAVGEYWSYDITKLHRYITETKGLISLFDVPLHGNLHQASINPDFDMSKMLDNTLVSQNPLKAVTFVDNHDTQPGQALQSFVAKWFKPIAYSIILLRQEGYPCVFYGDYYGIPHDNIEPVNELKILMQIRKDKAYGACHNYFDDKHIIGWTLEGDNEHLQSGLAVVISNSGAASKKMYIGTHLVGEKFIDCLGNVQEIVTIDEEGMGEFKVNEKSVSVWVVI